LFIEKRDMQTGDEHFMAEAMALADAAAAAGDVPVGAVLVSRDGDVLATGRNRREELGDPTAHAELEALRASTSEGWRREGTTLYVTLEPCPMCMGAAILARVERIVYGTPDLKAGAAHSLYRMGEDPRLNHRIQVEGGVLRERCKEQLTGFFRELRARRKQQSER
jgi:tRNA(adenine34) deaminase